MLFIPIKRNTGLGALIDVGSICLTKECQERKQETELLKQQILVNGLQETGSSLISDTSNTIKTAQYAIIAVGAAATLGILYYAFRPTQNTKKSKRTR